MSTKSKAVLIPGGTRKAGRRVAKEQRALGRAPRDFADYACAAAARGVWTR